MLFTSPVIAEGSGSIAGLTASRNRGGNYLRARAVPVNPNTPAQIVVRTQLATLTSRWSSVLTTEQREAWDLYSLNVLLPGPLGNLRNVGGLGMYIRTNISASLALRAPVDTAPAQFDLGTFTPVIIPLAAAATDEFTFTINNTDDWANEDDSNMCVFISRPVNPSINYFTGPYRFVNVVAGNATTPPTSAQTSTSAFPFLPGQQVFCRVQVLRDDGRDSTSQRVGAIAT